MVVTAPALGSRAVPALFKVTLALSMGVLLGPVIPGVSPAAATPPGTGGGVAPASSVVALGWMALGELLVGAAMGFVAGLVLLQAQFAGYLIDLEMGTGIANVVDPFTGYHVPILGTFFNLFATVVFLVMDGHHVMIRAFLESYRVVGFAEVGRLGWLSRLAGLGIAGVGRMFLCGLGIALPVAASLFLTTLALGLLSRSVPQMNVFMAGLSLKAVVGLAVLSYAFPTCARMVADGTLYVTNLLHHLLTGIASGGI